MISALLLRFLVILALRLDMFTCILPCLHSGIKENEHTADPSWIVSSILSSKVRNIQLMNWLSMTCHSMREILPCLSM